MVAQTVQLARNGLLARRAAGRGKLSTATPLALTMILPRQNTRWFALRAKGLAWIA